MSMVYVSFPVADVTRSTEFYTKLGFRKNDDFSNAVSSAMVWNEQFCIMLLNHDFYRTFIGGKNIADAKTTSNSLVSFDMPDAEAVDGFAHAAKENGGDYYHVDMGAPKDQMYSLEVQDIDGNILEPMWMKIPS